VSFAGGCVFQATAERPTSGLSYLCGVAALFTGVKAETTKTRSPDLEAALGRPTWGLSFSIVQRTVRTLELWPLLSALSCGSNGQENE